MPEIKLNISSIVIIEGNGSDEVFFNTENISSGIWPYDENTSFKVAVSKGKSLPWLKSNFGSEIEKIVKTIKTN